tara:strand:+ start:1852 stop:2967 length:1116 start_codon:yes stop_codon:yes gene_type:complete
MTHANGLMLKARAQLLLDEPFFGTLSLRLKLVIDDSKDMTMATDGVHLYFNPKWVSKIDNLERKGVVAHEVMHCGLNHSTRRQNRDPKLWNAACDFAINGILIKMGFILPAGGLHDPKYDGMSAEEIYPLLVENPPPKIPDWGGVLDAPTSGLTGTSPAMLESEWQVAVTSAAEVAKQAGKMPEYLQEFVRDIIKPVVDWRSVLWPFFTSRCNDEYSWRKPNRAYIGEDEYLPSLYNERVGTIAIINDSSGSTKNYWQMFISEMAAVHSMLQPEKIIILHCDTEVKKESVQVIEAEDEFPQENSMHGGGGTRFAPAFRYLDEHYPDIEAAVYLTDLESDDFGPEPAYPVLWVSTERDEAPWGETTYIQLES